MSTLGASESLLFSGETDVCASEPRLDPVVRGRPGVTVTPIECRSDHPVGPEECRVDCQGICDGPVTLEGPGADRLW